MRLSVALVSGIAVAACSGGSSGAYDGNYGLPYDGGPAETTAATPEPTVLASGLVAPKGLALIGTDLFASDQSLGEIIEVPAAGGPVTTLATGLGQSSWLATDGTQLFASDQSGGRVLAISTQGQVTSLATGQASPGRLLVANGTLYWINLGTSTGGSAIADGTGAIMALATTGGTPKSLASNLNTPHDFVIVAATNQIFFTEVGPQPNCATGSNWQQVQAESRIATIPLEGGPPASFAQQPPPFVEVQSSYLTPTGAGQARGLATDPSGQQLFFSTRDICWPSAGQIYQTTTTPSANLTTLSVGPPSSDRLDASATVVTWASQALISQIAWAPPGSAYANMVSQTNAGDFLWSGAAIYWTDQEAGGVFSLAL